MENEYEIELMPDVFDGPEKWSYSVYRKQVNQNLPYRECLHMSGFLYETKGLAMNAAHLFVQDRTQIETYWQ